MSLLRDVQLRAARTGLNLFGLVDAERFDRCQPREQRTTALQRDCGSIIVLATAGAAFWRTFVRHGGRMPEQADGDTVDELTAAGSVALASGLERRDVRCRVVDSRKPVLNFARLGEAAGFGTVSPISGMLLHPEYGPWLRVRAALLVDGHPFGAIADASITERFQPCCGCDKPCVTACPSAIHDGFGTSDRARCAAHVDAGGCDTGCHSRLACPVGSEHRDSAGPPLHVHSTSRRTVQRWFGVSILRIVPRFWRRGPNV